jgi:hypothetical protein
MKQISPKLNSNPNLTVDGDSLENILKIYTNKFHELFGGDLSEKVTEDKEGFNSFEYATSKGSVSLWHHRNLIGINIEGADTSYWNNGEYDSLDDLFWSAVGVLRNGIKYRKPLIGFNEAWVFSDELNKWVVVPKVKHSYGYTKFLSKSPKF